jgi:hypothetical protein
VCVFVSAAFSRVNTKHPAESSFCRIGGKFPPRPSLHVGLIADESAAACAPRSQPAGSCCTEQGCTGNFQCSCEFGAYCPKSGCVGVCHCLWFLKVRPGCPGLLLVFKLPASRCGIRCNAFGYSTACRLRAGQSSHVEVKLPRKLPTLGRQASAPCAATRPTSREYPSGLPVLLQVLSVMLSLLVIP